MAFFVSVASGFMRMRCARFAEYSVFSLALMRGPYVFPVSGPKKNGYAAGLESRSYLVKLHNTEMLAGEIEK
jgi:hypothetical protein